MGNFYVCRKEGGVALDHITVTTNPTTTSYAQYDTFSTSGMVVTATFKDGLTADITSKVTVSPANGSTLSSYGTIPVTVSYANKSTSFNISVAQMTAIAVTTQPTTTTFKTTDPIDYTGIVVTGTAGTLTRNVTSQCTFSPAAGTYFDTEGTKTVTVTYNGLSTTFSVTCQNLPTWDSRGLDYNTWDTIYQYTKAGALGNVASVGDTKTFTLTTNETLTAVLVNIGSNDTPVDSNYYPLGTADFITQNCLNTKYKMSSNSSSYANSGGWRDQRLRTTLNSTIYETLPSDLKNVIINKAHTYDCGSFSQSGSNYYWTSNPQIVSDKLWLPTYWEMFGAKASGGNASSDNGTYSKKYSLFTDDNSRKKQVNGDNYAWWTSTPGTYSDVDYTRYFYIVGGLGWGDAYTVNTSYGVPLCFRIGKPLEDYSWSEIQTMVQNGTLPASFVGQTKSITLSNNEVINMQLASINDGTGTAGTYYPNHTADFVAQNLTETSHVINSTGTNAGGWNSCEMRTYLNTDVWAMLPSDIKSVIVSKTHLRTEGNQSTTLASATDNLWLCTNYEVGGTGQGESSSENIVYAIFTDSDSRKKYRNGATSDSFWWLSSPSIGGSTGFCVVTNNGNTTGQLVSIANRIALGFRIG